MLEIRRIKSKEAYPMLLGVHYAQRIPSISYAFGLFEDGVLEGVCCYGSPASWPLKVGICGPDYAASVIELNRLCLIHNKRNHASQLVSASLKMLPTPKIVVSFADVSQGHRV